MNRTTAALHSPYAMETKDDFARSESRARDALLAHRTRPAPERIRALSEYGISPVTRKVLDDAFAVCESVTIPSDPFRDGFDPDCSRLAPDAVRSVLEKNPDNRRWLTRAFKRQSDRFGLSLRDEALKDDPLKAADSFFTYLLEEVSFWEADAFPLEAMADLPNRYGWTFSTDAWSLREQLRREARVVRGAWRDIWSLAEKGPLLVILNERAPTDYMTSAVPSGAAIWNGDHPSQDSPVLLHIDVKIASSEHRDPLAGTPEGMCLERALTLARKLDRLPVLLDFSRRRFPRAFLRVCRFARNIGWGIVPLGKLRGRGRGRETLPGPKSSHGLPRISGDPILHLLDPWPISDSNIVADLDETVRAAYCKSPGTKPWQDDRIGARAEMEADADGAYRPVSEPWVVPVPGGWVRADELFKSRLARFLRFENP